MEKVIKRDGRIVDFNQVKITTAIWKAMRALKSPDERAAQALSDKVVGLLEGRFTEGPPTVEDVQDVVEDVLVKSGRTEIARAYILYRKQHADLRDVGRLISGVTLVDDYLDEDDWRVRENSNMTYSLQGLNTHVTQKVISRYWLNKIYPREIREAHVQGDFHLHDLGTLGAYCCGWELMDLLRLGFQGVPGKVESRPARHFRVALLQMVNFMYTLQGESAGAQAFSNVDSYLAPFIRADGLSYAEVTQNLQEFIYNMNVPTRVGFQSPFTNVTLDLNVPNYMKGEPVIIGGQIQDTVYGDYQHEMEMFNRAFAEVMIAGDAHGRPFTFPIPTYNITEDFDWDNPRLKPVWEMTAKYGIPYFSNFIGSDMSPEDARSMCCRLRIDNRELKKRGGGLFGANPLTGSIGVVTINMPRLGYLSENEREFFSHLERLMRLAKESLVIKRKTLEILTEKKLYPYSKFYLKKIREGEGSYWKNHFSTIGLIGMNEAVLNMFGVPIADPKGEAFALQVLKFMRERLRDYQEETGDIFNLEATPAEGSSYRLAKLDLERYPDIRIHNREKYGGGSPYYTNSTQLPVGLTEDMFEALQLQDPLQTLYTGGTVFHGFLGERMPGPAATKRLVRKIAENFHLPYFTLTPTFSICPEHGYQVGEQATCPICGAQTEIYSRVVGYLRPVTQWNAGKQEEFADRKVFDQEPVPNL
ncbi:MAG: ribonucleoside triphosphate reductase [Candidatus Bipolaricaulota bacterium]|nr:ribonucleoside triphosphate reductase [Candidatus Bipolaricaulota bacterium]